VWSLCECLSPCLWGVEGSGEVKKRAGVTKGAELTSGFTHRLRLPEGAEL
jgi:hypothetical protein